MNSKRFFVILSVLLALVPMTAFGGNLHSAGAVYVMTNAPKVNEVVVFERNFRGRLTLTDSFATEGAGSGGGIDPLGSQGALILSTNQRWLIAVNAGSDNISSYKVRAADGQVQLWENIAAEGNKPIDIATTASGRYLYVLNAADGSVGAFRVLPFGFLKVLGTVAGLPLLSAQGIAAR